jgi:hypothetical protein
MPRNDPFLPLRNWRSTLFRGDKPAIDRFIQQLGARLPAGWQVTKVAQDSDIAEERQWAALMSNLRGLKQRLSAVSRLWDAADYDQALAPVESLLETWPGNPHLHVLKASLVQLQEEPKYDLDPAKQSLNQPIELDKDSPTASIELGHFLDNVEDNPQAAIKAYTTTSSEKGSDASWPITDRSL